ncbi:MAG: hypothetical protein KGN76_01085 [Acidobacteriota bacterium]|nr:hypothetical protein [Acidobacteriota bacterium]
MTQPVNPDELEVASGAVHERLEGLVWQTATEAELREGLEKAFDYRGDVTLTLKDGTLVEGYVFDRRPGDTMAASVVRLYPKQGGGKVSVAFADIAGLTFTGRDTAAGKGWEAWVKQYWEKKAAGETHIERTPERLD